MVRKNLDIGRVQSVTLHAYIDSKHFKFCISSRWIVILGEHLHSTEILPSRRLVSDFPCQDQGQRPFHQNGILYPNLRIRSLFQCVFTEVFPETDSDISTTYIIYSRTNSLAISERDVVSAPAPDSIMAKSASKNLVSSTLVLSSGKRSWKVCKALHVLK